MGSGKMETGKVSPFQTRKSGRPEKLGPYTARQVLEDAHIVGMNVQKS
jgi:hypothetical protein